ncbi:hypothetical protein ACFFJX_27570 [Pseudarcicella hirudinis]|uniref:hypothetical protein n=1 Tax=Pseudarcicella hirudinis TaxID=1079859 RepID=UPI0035E6099B
MQKKDYEPSHTDMMLLGHFFVKRRFQVTDVYITPSEVFGLLTVRCVQVGSNLDWNFLQNHAGVNILTNTGQPITIDQENGYRDYNYLYTNANQLLTNSNGMKIKINEL